MPSRPPVDAPLSGILIFTQFSHIAEQVKRVQTRALVNETSTESLIKKLKEENSRLQEMLKNKSNELMKDPSDANKEGVVFL